MVGEIKKAASDKPVIVVTGWQESQILDEFTSGERPNHIIEKTAMAASLPNILAQFNPTPS